MSSEKEYGYSICPLETGQSCGDFDAFGTIACGICGADKELAKEGQENFLYGFKRIFESQ
mgnify:CR=1 FL=1